MTEQPQMPQGMIDDDALVTIAGGWVVPWAVVKMLAEKNDKIRRLESEIEKLRTENEKLLSAILWVEPTFVDENTPEAELRQRVKFLIADKNRATLEGKHD